MPSSLVSRIQDTLRSALFPVVRDPEAAGAPRSRARFPLVENDHRNDREDKRQHGEQGCRHVDLESLEREIEAPGSAEEVGNP